MSTKRRGGRSRPMVSEISRSQRYRQLKHPFDPQTIFSSDEIVSIHNTALKVIQTLGIKTLLPEARDIFKSAGARVKDEMVFIGEDIVASALKTAPSSIILSAANPENVLTYKNGALIFSPGAGCPNIFDRERGRRPGDLNAYIETIKLHQSFDVIHKLGPSA